MKKWRRLRASGRHSIFLIILFTLSGISLYFSLPQEARFRFEYQKGRPWMHTTLYAPFDFAIQKSKEEIEQERDSVLKGQIPYLDYVDSISIRQMVILSERIDLLSSESKLGTSEKNNLKRELLSLYDKVYRAGILEQSHLNYPHLARKSQLKIVRNNVSKEYQIASIYSLKSAYNEVRMEQDRLKLSKPEYSGILDKLSPDQFLAENLVYDQKKNQQNEARLLDNISTNRGLIQQGERIISQGDVVDSETYTILESLRLNYESKRGETSGRNQMVAGRIIFIFILLMTLYFFLYSIRRNILRSRRDISFVIITLTLMIGIYSLILRTGTINIYVVPFTILALIIRTFIDSRVAIFVNTVTALIVGFMVPNGYEFVLLQIPVGSIAVISQSKMIKREQLIITSLLVFLSYSAIYTGITMIQESELAAIDWEPIKWFAFNAFLTLVTYLLVYILEKPFGFVSDLTLVELTFSNHPLLKKLAYEAPGTLHHSLQVANLSEQAISLIGGNALLVRAGALYHDVGKIVNSEYFSENQMGGINPHDNLSYEDSAAIIIGHVQNGVELGKKHNLPDAIIDFIRMHHGTTKTGYFYVKSRNSNETIDEKRFTYPGPVPNSRETAVVMLADAVEAASRSLEVKSSENIRNMIDHLFKQRIDSGQLEWAPLTFSEIRVLKKFFHEKLMNIYHIRILYPESEKSSSEQ